MVRLKPLSLETCHLPCLFLASLLGVWAKWFYETICQRADGKSVFPISHQKVTQAAMEGIGQAVATIQTRVGKETVLRSAITRLQAAPQETFSWGGPVFIGHPSVRLWSFMLSFRASKGCGVVCPAREGGQRPLALESFGALPLTHYIHV